MEAAYSGHEFPHTDVSALCPLCQQPLGDGAERLIRFDKYIREDAAKVAAEKRQFLEAAKTKIEQANLTIGLDDSLAAELTLLDETVVSSIRVLEASIQAGRTSMLDALATHSWVDVTVPRKNPRKRLRNLAAQQLKTARTLERASDNEKKKDLNAQRDELRARLSLGTCQKAVLGLVERMKLKVALENCKKDLKTRSITAKSKELASTVVTSGLQNALEDEFKSIGIGHIGTKLKERNVKGKTKYRLLLDLPTTHKLEEILSEGEQRAIAISSFLAELRLANHSGGIVFDDPVSSLDHWRRQHVARRLSEEANRRQVIVFTHDTSFLGQLQDELEAGKVTHLVQFLEWRSSSPGHVCPGLPWDHQKYTERIDSLEKAQKTFEGPVRNIVSASGIR